MAMNFPDSPSNGDTYTAPSGENFIYNTAKGRWASQPNSLLTVPSSIIPDTDSAYDLGSATNKFRSLYLSSDTLYLGDSASISAGSGGEIILPSLKIGTGANAVKLEADGSGKLKTKKVVGGVTQAAEEPGTATVVTDMAGLIAVTGMSAGQTALVTALNKMFVYTGTGWFLIATVTNSSPTDITGVNAAYSLASDGTATTITAVSTDPEGFALTWSYAVTTGSLGSTATVSQADNVFTITPSTTEADAGTFSITFSVTDGVTGAVSAVSAFTLVFGWQDISNASYDSLSFSVASQESSPRGMSFNSDGTKMFVLGWAADTVYQYSLTNGFSLAAGNVTYDNISFSLSSPSLTGPTDIAFNTDGTKMFVLGRSTDKVYQYSLTTGFDLSSVSYDNINFATLSQDGNPQSLAFNSDGTKMFMVGPTNSVYQYSLTTGFDLSSASYDNISFDISTQSGYATGLTFGANGTKMFVACDTNNRIYQYSLTNGFSMASGNVTYDNISFDVTTQGDTPNEVEFNSDGTKMFFLNRGGTIHQYSF